MATRRFVPVHPGVVLSKDFLKAKRISQSRFAEGIGVSPRRINEVAQGKRGLSAGMSLRLAKFFGMEAQFWMNLQSHYDIEIAKDQDHRYSRQGRGGIDAMRSGNKN